MHRASISLVLLVAIIGCGGFDTAKTSPNIETSSSDEDEDSLGKETPFAQVLFIPIDKPSIIYRINSEDRLKKLVLEPLDSAVPDARPARYVILGKLMVDYRERQEVLVLFEPWGHFKIGNEYKIADLSKLGIEITRELDNFRGGIDAKSTD